MSNLSPFLSEFSAVNPLASPAAGGINPMMLAMLSQNGSQPFSLAPTVPAVQRTATGAVSAPIPANPQPQNNNSSMGDVLGLLKLLGVGGGGSGGGSGNGSSNGGSGSSGGLLFGPNSIWNWSTSQAPLGGAGPVFGLGGPLGTGGWVDRQLGITGYTRDGNVYTSPITDVNGNVVTPMSRPMDPTASFTPDQLVAMGGGGSPQPMLTMGGGIDSGYMSGFGDLASLLGSDIGFVV